MSKSELFRLAVQRGKTPTADRHDFDQSRVTTMPDETLVAEASEIGLKPGVWPNQIGMNVGPNGIEIFNRANPAKHADQFTGYDYTSTKGRSLLVLND